MVNGAGVGVNENVRSSLGAIHEMDGEANVHKKMANMKCQRVKIDESYIPALEDEAIGVQHLLAEPKTDNVSVDGVFCFGMENSLQCSDIMDFSYGLEHELKRNCGGLDSNSQVPAGFDLGVLDGLLDGVDEVYDIHAVNDISGACEDFLLVPDIELADKVPDLECAPDEALLPGNTLDSQSPGLSAAGFSESSVGAVPKYECSGCSVGEMAKCELHVLSGDKWDCQAPADGNSFLTDGFENDAKLPLSGLSSDENEIHAYEVGKTLRQKRLRKPTKRYAEEFPDPKMKNAMGSETLASFLSKEKKSKTGSFNEKHHGKHVEVLQYLRPRQTVGRLKPTSAVSKDKCLKMRVVDESHVKTLKSGPMEVSGTSTRPQSESRPRRGHPRKCAPLPVIESDDYDDGDDDDDEFTASESESEDDRVKKRSEKGADRRKNQRMWTIPEVMKLIDGISQFGTGRWTDIKKLQFSSSTYRTPIDLRDKWRNLLRASCAQKSKKEVEQELKHGVRLLPKHILHRIRELASVHPYPKFSPGGKYIRSKK